MRSIFLWLAAGWLGGTLAACLGGSSAVIVMSAAAGCGAWASKKPASFAIAVGAVSVIGGVYAGSAAARTAVACKIEREKTDAVVSAGEVYGSGMRYELEGVSECEEGRVLAYADAYPVYEAGARVTVSGGEVEYVSGIREKMPGYADYLEGNGIGAVWRWADLSGRGEGLSVFSMEEQLLRSIDRTFAEPDAGLLKAMLLAKRGEVPVKIRDNFKRAGVSHILAISGLHISLLAGAWYALLGLFPIKPFWRATAALAGVWSYVVFIGSPASAQRAGWFVSSVILAWQFRRLTNVPSAAVLALIIMTGINPRIWLQAGFQLSFAAVAGIFIALFVMRNEVKRRKGQFYGSVYSAVAASVGATAATWPIAAILFNEVPVYGAAANILVVPAVSMVLPLGLAALAAGWAWFPAGRMIALAVHGLIGWMLGVADLIGNLPGAFLEGLVLPPVIMLFYYAALAGAAWWLVRRQGRFWREVWE